MNVSTRITIVLLLCVPAAQAQVNELHRVDLLTDGYSDRVVFEFDHRADYKMSSPAADVVEITFNDVDFSPGFFLPELPSGMRIVAQMKPHKDEKGKLVVTIHLQCEAEPTGITLSATPWKYAMDLAPRETSGEKSKPRYVPGDRPFRTKYTDAGTASDKSGGGVRMSGFAFVFVLLLAFAAGAASLFAVGYMLERKQRPRPGVSKKSEPTPAPEDALQLELERDLTRLKRTVERQQHEPWSAQSAMDARQELILKLMKEGRSLDAIAQVLDMPAEQVRKILDSQS